MLQRIGHHPRLRLALETTACLGLVACTIGVAFRLHFNLSTAGFIELLLVVLVALRLGFLQATLVSCSAVLALNYLFIPPVFHLAVADPQNWISLATFEVTALIVSGLSAKVRAFASEASLQTQRSGKLYELSRAILLIPGGSQVQDQVCALIREIIQVEHVQLVVFPRVSHGPTSGAGLDAAGPSQFPQVADSMDYVGNVAQRTLRIGTTAIGTLILSGWENEESLADAVASLAAIAIERARAVQEESRAENERDTERLRAAVLDGLAHSYKTPLTAIQTASSGLLALGDTNPTQTELISIVDEQATLLNSLTTRLLRTASLEGKHVRLRKSPESLLELVQRAIQSCDPAVRRRILVKEQAHTYCNVDADFIVLALSQLIDNAVKYADIDTAVDVEISTKDGEGTVTVTNVGEPIATNEREKIFERFYRGSNAAGGSSGSGLGLSIVRKAAAAHDGRVLLKTDGRLTSFSFTVPA